MKTLEDSIKVLPQLICDDVSSLLVSKIIVWFNERLMYT